MSPGRPKLPPDQKRTERVSVALSPDEHDRVCVTAARLRIKPSELIRLLVLPDTIAAFYFGSESNTDSF